uniref:Double zinc ribbon and ankyrin repeat-containing protein 1 n=1 Tax=Hucho hucho TaxID=62062 RepID=A0A4W5P6R9_9TELE
MAAGCIVVPLIIPIRIPPPGKAKHEIDTTTPVEIGSDTPDVTIYYTLDGTKPEVTKRPGFGENSTLKYSGPIRLPEGKVSVKALNKVICQSCGTGNPPHISNCVTCETKLLQPPTSAPPLPSGEGKMVSCSKCSRVNHSDARFCDWCGSKPGHSVSCLICSRCGASSHPYANFCGSCGAVPSSVSPGVALAPAPARADQQTQTVGLFYPSGTEVHRKGQQVALELRRQEQMRDRRPLLTAISPGRGYWRKQLDHVCAHLRSYTQNNTEFRALIGEPRMGRPSKDSLLLREVGPDGRGEISVVQQLLDEGADPSCQGCDGHPALVVAVLHEHHEVLPVLVQRGADVNQQSGPVKNTALHEAAALGSKGLQCAETLLGCNASIRKKNDRGLTAYDLAVTSDCSPLVSLLAAKMGQGMLDRLVKLRTHPSRDAF